MSRSSDTDRLGLVVLGLVAALTLGAWWLVLRPRSDAPDLHGVAAEALPDLEMREGPRELPEDVAPLLRLGSAEEGRRIYSERFGCAACHGELSQPESNVVGPHLAELGRVARERVVGLSAAQYIYEAIVHPQRVLAPECVAGAPCGEVTAMPSYADLLTPQEAGSLVVYLLQETPPRGAPARE